MKSLKYLCCCCLLLLSIQQTACAQATKQQARDLLIPATPGSVTMDGYLGNKMSRCIHQRLIAQPVDRLIEPFRIKNENDFGGFRCEYWGKWFTATALACAYYPGEKLQQKIQDAVTALCATQDRNGYIGTYAPQNELKGWDVWGRKYVLLGLIADYDLTHHPESLKAACKTADHLMTQFGPGKKNIIDNGLDAIDGLSSSSLLEPVSLLYQRTGNTAYRDFAEYIIAQWSKPSRTNAAGLRLIEKALEQTDPINIAAPKAYEMMSCYEGLCEQYRATGNKKYLAAAVAFANRVAEKEIMITGSGSDQELWSDGVRQQTQLMQQPVETCVTVTWMKLCYQLLRLTGDPQWADYLETALYNALLGAMTPDGTWWSYFSPLTGERVPSTCQHADVGLSCCVANGPRGLLLTPAWAVMSSAAGPVINLFAAGSYRQKVGSQTITLLQHTDYPVTNKTIIELSTSGPVDFTLTVRIPKWSAQTHLSVNGQRIPCKAGSYAKIKRVWHNGDKVTIGLDFRGRVIPAPSGSPELSVMRGPIVLALDSRLVQAEDTAVVLYTGFKSRTTEMLPSDYRYLLPRPLPRPDQPPEYISLQPVQTNVEGIHMAFEATFAVRPTHFFNHHLKRIILCDYASAGNRFDAQDLFRVWLPQPLFLKDAFVTDTWKLMYPEMKTRPQSPLITTTKK